jgi:hypothetical protein
VKKILKNKKQKNNDINKFLEKINFSEFDSEAMIFFK